MIDSQDCKAMYVYIMYSLVLQFSCTVLLECFASIKHMRILRVLII